MYAFRNWPTPQETGVNDEDVIHQWEERLAICTFDGGLDEQAGRRIAWEQILTELRYARLGPLTPERLQHA